MHSDLVCKSSPATAANMHQIVLAAVAHSTATFSSTTNNKNRAKSVLAQHAEVMTAISNGSNENDGRSLKMMMSELRKVTESDLNGAVDTDTLVWSMVGQAFT